MGEPKNEIEVWQTVPEFKDYQVSNLGRVRSLDKMVIRLRKGTPSNFFRRGKILKPIFDGGGYPMIQIGKKNIKIHYMVCSAFLGVRKTKGMCVNHKNGIKTDNRLCNLEWVTNSENSKHALRSGLRRHGQTGKCGKLHRSSKPLISIQDTAIIEHESRSLAAKYFGVHVKAINSAMTKGHRCKGHRIYSL